MKKLGKKRGVVEVQFNWIFILIAGAVILFFFIRIIANQKQASGASSDLDVLEYLEKIISGTEMEIGTTRNVTIANLNVEVTEGEISLPGKSIGGKSLRNKIVFAPDLIKGNKLIIHSDYWSCPYKITPFIYLTSNEVRYIILNRMPQAQDDVLAQQMYELLPEFTTKERINSLENMYSQEKNNYEIRLIVFAPDSVPQVIVESNNNFDVTAIRIEPGADDKTLDEYGTVTFYKLEEGELVEKGNSYYLRKESLLGAVITDTKEYYEANMAKAFSSLNSITNISYERASKLYDYCANTQEMMYCTGVYSNPQGIDVLSSLLQINSYTKNPSGPLNDETAYTVQRIFENGEDIALVNKDLQRYSCPILY